MIPCQIVITLSVFPINSQESILFSIDLYILHAINGLHDGLVHFTLLLSGFLTDTADPRFQKGSGYQSDSHQQDAHYNRHNRINNQQIGAQENCYHKLGNKLHTLQQQIENTGRIRIDRPHDIAGAGIEIKLIRAVEIYLQ